MKIFLDAKFLIGLLCVSLAGALAVSCVSRAPEVDEYEFEILVEQCDGDYWAAMDKFLYITKSRIIDTYILEFPENGHFRIPKNPLGTSFIDVRELHDVIIDGMGSTVELDAYNGFLTILKSKNIVVKNFNVVYSRLGFTQGDILKVDESGGFFLLKIDKNYPMPPADKWAKENFGHNAWEWGSVFVAGELLPKKGVPYAWPIGSVEATDEVDVFKISVRNREDISKILVGDRFVMPLPIEHNSRRENETALRFKNINSAPDGNEKLSPPPMCAAVSVLDSSNILIEDINMSRVGMCGIIAIANAGRVTFENCKIEPAEGDEIATWRYGMLFVSNKTGPIVNNCSISKTLDDAIAIASHPAMIEKIEGERKYALMGGNVDFGNKILVFYPNTGKILEDVRIVEKEGDVITTDRPIPNLITGSMRRIADANATQIYNLDAVNNGFSVSNNIIEHCGASAITVAAKNGFVVANTIRNTRLCGVSIENESGAVFAGPLPKSISVVGNRISETGGAAVKVGAATSPENKLRHEFFVHIADNKFVVPEGGKNNIIELQNGERVSTEENEYLDADDEYISGEGTTLFGKNFVSDKELLERAEQEALAIDKLRRAEAVRAQERRAAEEKAAAEKLRARKAEELKALQDAAKSAKKEVSETKSAGVKSAEQAKKTVAPAAENDKSFSDKKAETAAAKSVLPTDKKVGD